MNNNKGFTMIELIAVLIIISVITVTIIPKIIDLESSAERKLLGIVLAELTVREKLAFVDFKLGNDYVPINRDDLMGVSLEGKNDDKLKLIFDGGGTYAVYRTPNTEQEPGKWYAGKYKKPKPPKKKK